MRISHYEEYKTLAGILVLKQQFIVLGGYLKSIFWNRTMCDGEMNLQASLKQYIFTAARNKLSHE